MALQKVLDRVREEIIEAGRDNRYALNAYGFVLDGLEYCRAALGRRRHVTGQELSRSLAEFAAKQFGPMACTVLKSCGVHATEDFGYIVYNLIDIKVLRKQESDTLRDFFAVLDLQEYLAGQEYFVVDREEVRRISGA